MLKQRKPMQRGQGFKAKLPAPKPCKTCETYTPRARPLAVPARPAANAEVFRPAPKDEPLQHAGYIDLVRALPCAHCGRPPRSVFCHADILGRGGKGRGIKSDCRLGWPGCKDEPGREGCHTLIGSRGTYTKAARHELEARYGQQTRATILERGLWPKRLPLWTADDEGLP